MVLATPSVVTRGAAHAIFWLAPPPYPYAIVDTTAAAFAHIELSGGPNAASALASYDTFVRRYLPETAARLRSSLPPASR